MDSNLITFHQFSTMRTLGLLETLTNEEWFPQPDGFANNIAWNVGHVLLVRQNLIFRNSGMETGLEGLENMYKPGSSPADWENQPDPGHLLELYKTQSERLISAVSANAFADLSYPSFEIGGKPIKSLNDAATFNLWHEGLHGGVIMSLRDAIKG